MASDIAKNAAGVDPKSSIIAMYETLDQARVVKDTLVETNIVKADQVDVIDRSSESGHDKPAQNLWDSLKSLFLPEQDAHHYAEGLDRGHAMVVVRPAFGTRETVIEYLEETKPLDIEAQTEQWKNAGWSGSYAGSSGPGQPAVSSAPSPSGVEPLSATIAPSAAVSAVPSSASRQEEVIPIVEEHLQVGKREVDRGSVRVRSYVVEQPVREQVPLREEVLHVERHAVDRPVSELPADAFQEKTIEITAVGEQPVVAKEARVVEEVVVRKEAQARMQTVEDTVRHTKVEIEKDHDLKDDPALPKVTPVVKP